jgi:site-specific DNA-methyltransferase (adenine-specific)
MASRQSPEAFRAERVGETMGRWPANIVHDGSEEVLAAFPLGSVNKPVIRRSDTPTGLYEGQIGKTQAGSVRSAFSDEGSAARFFYTAKASAHDRNDGTYDLRPGRKEGMNHSPRENHGEKREATAQGNHHPTVKPTDLMRFLCRLVCPSGGTVLDPFMGSGSTLKAAELEGFDAIGIELDPAYIEIARRRIASDAPLFAEVA